MIMKGIKIKSKCYVYLLCCIKMIDDRWKEEMKGAEGPFILCDTRWMKRSDLTRRHFQISGDRC